MPSGGMFAESRCGAYRVYDNHDGTFGAGRHNGQLFVPIERRPNGMPKRYRTRRKAIAMAARHSAKGGA